MKNNYLKNVMKSVAYAASDVATSYTPSLSEFKDANKEFTTATYAALRNPKQFARKQVEALQESKIYKALDYGAKNLVEDLRSGNFYNKARKERDEIALSGLDANWDDLSEFGIDSDWENKTDLSDSKSTEVTAGDMKIVEAVEGSNAALASATVNAVVSSSQNEIKAGRTNTAMIYTQNERLFSGLHKDITVLGNTMQQMYNLQSASLQNIDKNISGFFTQESKLSAERNAILKEMLELQRNVYKSATDKEKEKRKGSNRIRWSDISSNGIPNLGEYFKAVKKNINNELAAIMPAGFGEDSNMLATFMTSPLEGVMKYVVEGVIPSTVKAAAKEFDGTVSGVFGNIIGALGNARSKNEGGLLGALAKFLGVSTSVNKSIDTSKYEKGPIPFDGITRKAIIDVIPTHLRRIEAAITGRPEEMFDYKAGRWVKVSDLQKQYDNIRKNAIKRATSELREAINPGAKAVRKGITDKKGQQSWDLALEEFEEFLYNNNGRFNPNETASKNGIDSVSYPNLYKHYSKVRTLFRDFDKIESKDRNGKIVTRNTMNRVRMQLSNSVLDARENEEKQYRDIETDVGNVLASFFGIPKHDTHGKYKTNGKFQAYNNLNSTKDNLGNTIFDYLQNINKELTYMRLNGVPGGGSYGKRKKGKYSEFIDFDKIDITNPSKEKDNQYAKDSAENDRIEKAALEAIRSGKAIDLRDFDVNEQAYLLQLSSMLKNNAVSEYSEEIKGYNTNNAITGFLDKHFIKTNIKSLKDVEKAIEKADKEGKNTNEVKMDAKEETFFRKILNRIGQGESILGGIVGASSEAFTNLLYTADKAIYEMMYKTEIDGDESKKKYKGFMDMIVNKTSDTFKTIKDKLKEDLIDPFLERFGLKDKLGKFKEDFTKDLKKKGSKLWTAFKDANVSVYGPAYHDIMIRAGLEKGSTLAQQRRLDSRKEIGNKINKVKSTKNLLSDDMIAMMHNYGLNFTDYDNIENARGDLTNLLVEELFRSSNNLKDDIDVKELDLIMDYLKKNPKALRSVIRSNKINTDDLSDEQIPDFVKNKIIGNIHKRSETTRWKLSLGKNTEQGVSSDYFEKVGFTGELNEKKAKLKEEYEKYGETISDDHLTNLKTEADVEKAYLRLINRHHTHAKGTTGKPFSGLTTLTKGEGLIGGNGSFGIVPKTGVYNIPSPTHIVNTEQMHDLGLSKGPRVSVQSAYGKEKLAAEKAGFSISHNDAGTMNITDGNGDNLGAKGIFEEAKKFIPEAAAGGLVGGILSLVLGLAGGPLVGAAVGAGGSIIAGSDKLKQKLFGKAGEDGKNDGSGIISKSIMDKFNKYFPDMTKYGLAGLIPGLLTPLGPIGGLMAGAAFGFLKNNERFTNKYFGEKGKLSIGSKEKKIIQDMLPGALKGAAIGAIAKLFIPSPFGIVGNAVIGAGLGMMASTEEFKNSILGREVNGERIGGLVNTIKDSFAPLKNSMADLGKKLIDIFDKNIIDPITRFVTPSIHALPQLFSLIPRKINEWFKNTPFGKSLEGFIKDKIMTPFAGIMQKFVSPVVKGITNVVTSPVKLLGFAGDKIREKQIETGNADYMTARERIDFMIKKGKGKQILESDKVLADIGTKGGLSVEDAEKSVANLQTMFDTKDSLYASRRRQEKKINSILDGYKTADGKQLSPKTKKLLRQAMEAGDMDRVRGILSSSALQGSDTGLSEAQIKTLMDGETGLGTEIKRYMGITDREKAIEGLTKEDQENKKKANIDLFKRFGLVDKNGKIMEHEARKFMANMQTEILDRKANETGKDEVALETENNKMFKSMTDSLQVIRDTMLAMATGDDKLIKKLSKQHDKEYDDAMGDLKSDFKERRKQAAEIVGEKKYAKFNNEVKDVLGADTISAGFGIQSYNKNLELIKEYNLSPNEVNACNGDVERLSKIKKLGYSVIIKDIPELNKYGETDFKLILKFLEYKYTKEIFGKKRLKKSDMDIMIHTNLSEFKNRCKFVFTQNHFNPKDFDIEKVMTFQGDRTGEGLKQDYTPVTFADKFKGIVKNAAKFMVGIDDESQEEPIANNSLGTILSSAFNIGKSVIGGIGKVGSAIGKGAKAVGKGIGSLFKGEKEGGQSSLGVLGALGGMINHINPFKHSAGIGSGSFDETDRAGDGKDVHMTSEGPVMTERTSDGSVEYDTSDAQTKDVLNKLSLKEKLNEKFQQAQIKASELLHKTFDTSNIPESKGGKIGLLGLLAGGALLWKSGILKKLYEGFIKPIWTDNIKPWITDTALPWINNTLLPKLGSLLASAIKAINWSALLGGFFDGLTGGNKNNAGAKTKINSSDLSETYDASYETGMTDENGKALTVGDISSGNYKEIYNSEGVQGYVDSNGKIVFEDTSTRGSSAAKTIGNASIHSFIKSFSRGKSSKLVTMAAKASGKLAKSKNLFAKAIGKGGQAITGAVDFAENLGFRARGNMDMKNLASKVREIKKANPNLGTKDIYEQLLKNGDESATIVKNIADSNNRSLINKVKSGIDKAKTTVKSKADGLKGKIKNIFKEGSEDAIEESAEKIVKEGIEKGTKEVAEAVVEEGAKGATKAATKNIAKTTAKVADAAVDAATTGAKNKGLLTKLATRLKDALTKLWDDPKVTKMLTKLGTALGKTNVGKWLLGIKESIEKVFKEALEKGIKKAGTSTAKNVLGKALWWVMLITDFLTGCDQAESILGVSETTIVEEVIAGLINALCNLLVIPAIFPGVPWIAKFLFKIFGQDLEERQKQADEEYQKYVEETGSTLTKEEWLKRQHSVTGKIGGWFSDQWAKITGKNKKAAEKAATTESNAAGTIQLATIASNASGTIDALNIAYNNIAEASTNLGKDDKLDKIMKKTSDGKISIFSKEYWKSSNDSDTSFAGTLKKSYSMITKITNLPLFMIKNSLQAMTGGIEEVANALSEDGTVSDNKSTSTNNTSFLGKIKNFFSNAGKKIKGFFGSGTTKYGTGKYSKQIDPSIANIRFNSNSDSEYQTIGDSGCGPAAAVNAIESMYGRGNRIASAAKFALKRGYKETNGGTEPGFFGDYFNANGYSSQTTSNKSQLKQNIINGVPTVIMGRNPKGVSSSSPFGSNPHYVTITGVDGRGNAIVQDPESRYDNQLYPIDSLMKQTSFGSSVFGRGTWGKGTYDSNIWWYLKEMGMTDAGAAGMMGNLAAESGLHPDRLQGDNPYSQKSVDYTAKVDNGTVSEYDFVHKGPGGGGYGLAQWTSYDRKQGLYNLAKSRKTSIADIGTQLQWLSTELGGYPGLMKTLKSTNDIKAASDMVLTQFERPADQGDGAKTKRKNLGQGFFNTYKGTKGTEISGSVLPGNSTFTGEDSTDVNTESTNSSTDVFSYLSTAIDNLLGDKFTNITNKLSEIGDLTKYLKGFNVATTDAEEDADSITDIDTINSTHSKYADRMVEIAKNELNLGVKENPLGSDNVKYNDWYYGKKNNAAWCAAFVSWVANQAGVPTDVIPKYAYTPTGYNFFKNAGREVDKTKAKAGDILFTYSPSAGRISHTGIVTGMTGKAVDSIEGNWSNKVSAVRRGPTKAESKNVDASEYNNLHIVRPNYGTGTKNKPLSKYGQFKNSIYGSGIKSENAHYSINNESLKQTSKNSIANTNEMATPVFGMAATSGIDYTKLINSIIAILMTIADNTDKLNTIVSILNKKLNLNISASDVNNATSSKQTLKSKLATALNGINNSTNTNYQDNSINAIITAMNAIASE